MVKSIAVFGNCQVVPIATCIKLVSPGTRVVSATWAQIRKGIVPLQQAVESADLVFSHASFAPTVVTAASALDKTVLTFPEIYFDGYHPDAVNAFAGKTNLGALGGLTSGIALAAYLRGLPLEKALKLFRPDVYKTLGYHDRWERSAVLLKTAARKTDIAIDDLFGEWANRGPFMHVSHHPKLFAAAGLARKLVERAGADVIDIDAESYLSDSLMDSLVWPVYPSIGKRHGITEGYTFKYRDQSGLRFGELRDAIERCYAVFSESQDLSAINCASIEDPTFLKGIEQAIADLDVKTPKRTASSANPYRRLPPYQHWGRSMASIEATEVDPVVRPKFTITKSTRIATAGSCFAQHIARSLHGSGFNYFVPEPAPSDLSISEANERQYGLYSARFGNIYSVRQLVQLIDRAYGRFTPVDRAWPMPDRSVVDPFRPTVEPSGFPSIDALEADREAHFAAVRTMLEQCDVFVFTLGLTEAWRSKADGSVFPSAPGVITSEVDMNDYEFVNFDANEVTADINDFLAKLHAVNPLAKVILTVSPVPLMATYEDRHVLLSTTYSKAALRVAADAVSSSNENVAYFPSYEIITGNHARGAYFENDLRSVREEGVSHVMRLFLKHYCGVQTEERKAAQIEATPSLAPEDIERYSRNAAIICDEELLSA